MMLKLMITEDEPLVREGLKLYFNWSEFGVHQIFEAENGRLGVEIALREQPDIIITDIRMPELDGLEMIAKLKDELPNTIFIILTGYSEFQYAQKAIQYGCVKGYLLKPLQYEESLSTLKGCINEIKVKQVKLQTLSKLETEVRESVKLKESQAVKFLLDEEISLDLELIESPFLISGDSLTYQTFVLTCISKKETPYDRFWLRSNANDIISKIVNIFSTNIKHKVFTYLDKKKLYAVVVYNMRQKLNIDHTVIRKLEGLIKSVNSKYNVSLFLAFSNYLETVSKLSTALKETEKDLYSRFFYPNQTVFTSKFKKSVPNLKEYENQLNLQEKDKKLIQVYLNNRDTDRLKQLMRKLAENITYTSYDRLLVYLQEIIMIPIQFSHKNNIRIEGVYNEKLLNLECVDYFQNLIDLFDWLASWMHHLSNDSFTTNNQDTSFGLHLFEQIKGYILSNIDQELTLNIVAEHFFYSPSYLSRLFKAKLNKNYMIFVTEIRIEYAKQCLEQPNYSIKEVCNMCGYKSYKHFVKTFKSVTEMTPSEYRKRMRL